VTLCAYSVGGVGSGVVVVSSLSSEPEHAVSKLVAISKESSLGLNILCPYINSAISIVLIEGEAI
jgi:hypothetical protein